MDNYQIAQLVDKAIETSSEALGVLNAKKNMLATEHMRAPQKVQDDFSAAVSAIPSGAHGEAKASFIAETLDVTEAAQRADISDRMQAGSLGAPINATPIYGGIVRQILQMKVLAPDEIPYVDTDPNSYMVHWVGQGGAILSKAIDFTTTACELFELRTRNHGIRDTEVSRYPWDARGRIRVKVSEARELEEDSYMLALLITAAQSTNGTSDDHLLARAATAVTQQEMLALLQPMQKHGGAQAIMLGENPLFDIFKWGLGTTDYHTLFTPATREEIIRTGSVGSILGARVIYNRLIDDDPNGSDAYNIFALAAPQQLGYLFFRPIEGVVVKTGTDFDPLTDEHLFWQKETVGITIANSYGVALSQKP
jgi:hypothetical protein